MNRRTFLAWSAVALAATPASATAADSNWRAGTAMPVERSEFGAALLNGAIVVAGGFDAGVQVDAFDLRTGDWRRLADLPRAVHHPGVAALGGALYVAGGYDVMNQSRRVKTHQCNDSPQTLDLVTQCL